MGRLYYFVYRVATYLLLPVILIRLLIRGFTNRAYWNRLGERLGWVPPHVRRGSIWIHAVSVGEVNAAKPLVERLLETQDAPILVSCTTPTGAAQAERHFGERVATIYAPIDVGFAVVQTLNKVRPCALIIVETELWPNLLRSAQAKQVPVAFANLRLSDRTFKRAGPFLPLSRHALKGVESFCVQTPQDASRIVALGADADRVSVTGNLKFDMDAPDTIEATGGALRKRWGGARPVIVLASSHEGEEQGFLKLLPKLHTAFPDLLALIVPRHPERFEQVYQQISGLAFNALRRSQWQANVPAQTQVILVDSMGELLQFYAAADIAVVGGSFFASGGHNILEPLKVGTPLVFGPNMTNFQEIVRLVIEHDAGEQVSSLTQLGEVLPGLLTDQALRQTRVQNGFELLKLHRGALDKTVDRLSGLLELR